MLVQCPHCQTTYKVSDNLVQGVSPTFRCSRCQHTFALEGRTAEERDDEESPASPGRLPRRRDEEEELSFSFPPREEGGDVASASPSQAAPTAAADEDRRAVRSDDEEEEPWSMSSAEPPPEESFTIAAEEAGAETAGGGDPDDPPPANILPLDPHRDRPISTLPYLTLLGLLILFFSVVTAVDQADPKTTEGYFRAVPWLGSSLFKNNHLKDGVALQSFRYGFQSILGNRRVFVVSGVASNQNAVAIRDVQVAGRLYDPSGSEIEEQAIWVGNAISPKIVRGMTAQDISDLQRLKPLRSFEIPSGESVPFTIVFLRSSKQITDFSCRILAAEGGD